MTALLRDVIADMLAKGHAVRIVGVDGSSTYVHTIRPEDARPPKHHPTAVAWGAPVGSETFAFHVGSQPIDDFRFEGLSDMIRRGAFRFPEFDWEAAEELRQSFRRLRPWRRYDVPPFTEEPAHARSTRFARR